MRRTSLVFTLVVMILSISLTAQEADSIANESNFAKPLSKHEVNISLNPLFMTFNTNTSASKYYLSYKYNLDKLKLRTAFSFITNDDNYPYTIDNGDISYTDTSLTIQYKRRGEDNYSLRLGIEFTKQLRFVEWIFGVDLMIGFENEITDIYEQNYYSIDGSIIEPEITPLAIGMEVESFKDQYLNVGITPSVGLNIRVSDHISTGVLLLIDIYYGNLLNSNKANKPGNTINLEESLYLMFNVKF